MTQIEDVHLHHEAKICHNDMIIISNKKINCQSGKAGSPPVIIGTHTYASGIAVVVGPVIGLVTQTSVNILVETDAAAMLSVNVFMIDSISQDGQYIKTEVFTDHIVDQKI